MEDYLKKFKEKHSLSDEECKRYGEADIEFDIEMDMPNDALEQWDEYVEKNGYISFSQWTGVDNGYAPKDIDNSGMEDLKSEFGNIFREMERSFDEAFAPFYDEDSDSDDSDFLFDEDFDFEEEEGNE